MRGPRHAAGGSIVWPCHQRLGTGAGVAGTPDGFGFHAFLWDGTTMLDFGTLGGAYSHGFAINASGQVTGFSSTADGSGARLPVGRHHDAGPQCPH